MIIKKIEIKIDSSDIDKMLIKYILEHDPELLKTLKGFLSAQEEDEGVMLSVNYGGAHEKLQVYIGRRNWEALTGERYEGSKQN